MVVWFTTTYVISAYHHQGCEFEPRSWRGVLDTTLCDQVCRRLATGLWFSRVTPVSSNNKTDDFSITELLLKVALNTHHPNPQINVSSFKMTINNRIMFTCFHFLNILFNKWNLFYQYTSGNIILTIKHVCTQPRIITYASTIIKEAVQNIYSTVKWHYTEKKLNRDNIFYTFKSCYICYTEKNKIWKTSYWNSNFPLKGSLNEIQFKTRKEICPRTW